MALIFPKILQITIRNQEFWVKSKNLIENAEIIRNYATKKSKKSKKNVEEQPCGMEPCNEPKRSIWNLFCGKNKRKQRKPSTSPYVTPKPTSDQQICQDLGELQKLGDSVYKTCGEAYIVQKRTTGKLDVKMDPDKAILDEMTTHPSLKGQTDPMPPFESVEQRLIELSERKLHPLYKYLMSIPKKNAEKLEPPRSAYTTRSGAILADEVPDHLGINKELFERKNLNCDFKRIDPPQPLLAQIVEMAQNQRPTMDPKNSHNNSHNHDSDANNDNKPTCTGNQRKGFTGRVGKIY